MLHLAQGGHSAAGTAAGRRPGLSAWVHHNSHAVHVAMAVQCLVVASVALVLFGIGMVALVAQVRGSTNGIEQPLSAAVIYLRSSYMLPAILRTTQNEPSVVCHVGTLSLPDHPFLQQHPRPSSPLLHCSW